MAHRENAQRDDFARLARIIVARGHPGLLELRAADGTLVASVVYAPSAPHTFEAAILRLRQIAMKAGLLVVDWPGREDEAEKSVG